MKKQNEQKFSIRKYSVGIASVLVGSLLFGTGVAANTPTETFDPSLTDGLVQDGPVNEEVKDYTAVITVDGVEVARQTEFITLSDLKAKAKSLAAVEEADETLEFAGFVESDNTLEIQYVTKAEKPEVTLEWIGDPYVEETNEVIENFTLTVVVDGKETQVSEYPGVTNTTFLTAVAVIADEFTAEGAPFTYDFKSPNHLVLNVTAGVKSEWVEDEYVNSVNPTPNPEVTAEWTGDEYVEETNEVLENFVLTVNVDGKHQQTSSYEAIPYSKFLEAVGAIAEGLVAEGYAYNRLDWPSSNEAVLQFSTPVKSEWVEDEYVNSVNPTANPEVKSEWVEDEYVNSVNPTANPEVKSEWVEDEYVNSVNPTANPEVKSEWVEDEYVNSVNTPATAPVATVAEVATKTEAKVATPAVAEAKTKTDDAKTLPETGTKETVALVSAGLMLIATSVGLSILKRRN